MSKKSFVFYFGLIILLQGLFLISPPTARALTVGPVKVELEGDPGDTLIGEFFLMNETGNTRTFYSDFEKYVDTGGDKKFLGRKEDLSAWVETQESITLNSQQQAKIPYTVKIPLDAPAGSHFAVAWWGSAPPQVGQGVAIVSKAGILMLLTVSGDINESARVSNFSSPTEQKVLNFFPPGFSVAVENTGNVYIKPVGKITVKNIFGITKEIFDVNKVNLEVYPKTVRGLRISTDKGVQIEDIALPAPTSLLDGIKKEWSSFGFGPYTAYLNLKYGKQNPQELNASLKFWVIPWRILTIVVIVLILILLFFTRGIKTYNQWIIKRAQNKSLNSRETKTHPPARLAITSAKRANEAGN